MATAAKTKMDVEKESESAEEGTKGDDNGADVSDFARRLRELFVEHKKMFPFSRVLLEKIMQTVCKEEAETQLSSETRSEESTRKNLEGILLDMVVSTTLKVQLEETRKDSDEKNTKLILAEEYLAIITQQQQEKLAGKDKEFKTINSRLEQRVAELEVTNSSLANEVENKDKELQTCYTSLTRIEDDCKRALSETAKEANERLEGIAQLQTELSEKGSDFEKEKEQLITKGDEAQQRISELESMFTVMKVDHKNEKIQLVIIISELESKFTVMKEGHKNEKIQLKNEMKEKTVKLIDELESKLKVKKDDDHEKEKLQLQKKIEHKDKLYDRLIQERDALKEKVEYYTKRLASLSEKRVKQDQRKVEEDTLGLNRQSELEKDINDFFDNERIDACELIQKKYGSEEENDILIYYPRLACMILETAYEQTVDARTAVVDLFEKMSEWMIVHASEAGRLFDRVIKDGRYSSWTISVDVPVGNKESEHPVDVDGLMLTLKETAHHANLDNFVQDVENIVYHKWMKWMTVEKSCGLTPSHTVLVDLRVYTEACIRLTWRMVTQVPPMSLEYQSTILDKRHKQLGYHCSQEMCTTGDGPDEEIACYLWPGLFDGGGRLIRQGEVLCKVKQHP